MPFNHHSDQELHSSTSNGRLLVLLTAALYGLFTLLPDSNSLMVSWPWVFIWQVTLICPVLWLLGLLWQKQLGWLGNGFDWVVGVLVLGVLLSAGLAEFPMQARWYSWALFCFLAALYSLNSWLQTPAHRISLLVTQGYLNLAFVLVSAALWTSQTLLPELARLRSLQPYGVPLFFDFAQIELRNWAPIGHQNYVAGYLILALPLLVGLGILHTGWRRWMWMTGVGVGLVDLYTTSSRAGWLGILFLAIVGFVLLLWKSPLPRRWLGLAGIAGLLILGLSVLSNNRLSTWITHLASGQAGSELAYRLITTATGWQMGLSHLISGIGPGGVPLLYQKYRPAWAGREAELAYQLHNTPAQVWAELGIWSLGVSLGAIVLLIALAIRWVRSRPAHPSRILIASILAALPAYGIVSLTDYQLDNVCISGTLVIYLAILTSEFRELQGKQTGEDLEAKVRARGAATSHLAALAQPTRTPIFALVGLGILLVGVIWLVPLHRAWMVSNQGFVALSRKDLNTFAEQLQQSQQIAPWEPYYAYQLGWNLGDRSLETSNPQERLKLTEDAIASFKQGIQASPYQEFGHSNLAWLLLNRDPHAATQEFARSAQLVPAKRGVLYGLGVSLLAQGKTDLAVEAMSLEILRDPLLLTSPVWKLASLQPIYGRVSSQVESRYTALLTKASPSLAAQLHQSRGMVRWWQGNLTAAQADLSEFGTPLSRMILDLAQGKSVRSQQALELNSTTPATGGFLAIAAWLEPAKRQMFLEQAWVKAMRMAPPAELIQQFVETMARSASFDQWLKQMAPSRQYRRERAGFGVLSRHVDGPTPADFLTVVENIPMAQFFDQLLPAFVTAPELDRLLQPQREALLKQIL